MCQPPPTHAIANGFHQLAYVVPDIAASEQFFIDTLGVPGFFRIEDIPVYDSTYRGGPGDYGMHLSLGYAGDTQIELVQPLRGRSLYQEFLDAHGPGLQHLGHLIDDEPATIAYFAAHHIPLIQSGRLGTNPGMRYAYFDTTPQIGIVTETLLLDDETRTLFARVKNGKHGVYRA